MAPVVLLLLSLQGSSGTSKDPLVVLLLVGLQGSSRTSKDPLLLLAAVVGKQLLRTPAAWEEGTWAPEAGSNQEVAAAAAAAVTPKEGVQLLKLAAV